MAKKVVSREAGGGGSLGGLREVTVGALVERLEVVSGRGTNARGYLGVPWGVTSAIYQGPGAHSTSPLFTLILALPPPCCVTLG